jgi:hypothetical protein
MKSRRKRNGKAENCGWKAFPSAGRQGLAA